MIGRLYTLIGRTDKDASGNKLDTVMRSTMERLRMWNHRTQAQTPLDRSLRQAFFKLAY
jgi:transcription initiation factor TFIIB